MLSALADKLAVWIPIIVTKFVIYTFAAFGVVMSVWVTYYQYEAMKKDPIYAATFFINVVVVVATAVWSYKSFGKDLKGLKKNMIIAMATQHKHDKDIGDIYGHLRNFGGRIQRLDGIQTTVQRNTGPELVNMED